MIKVCRPRARVPGTPGNPLCSRSGINAIIWLLGALVALIFFGSPPTRAGEVVTDCTELALRSALARSNVVTFATNCSITLAAAIEIDPGTTKQIDAGGHTVTLSGNNAVPLFRVKANGNLTLIGLTLANGHNTNGGALYVNPGGSGTAMNCTFVGNTAAGFNGT